MRVRARKSGTFVKAYAGSTGVLLAMDVEPERRAGLLGFALERKAGTGPKQWLDGQLHFPGQEHKAGDPIPTNQAPIQKFRWSDYRVFPGSRYQYTVHPVYGTPGDLKVEEGPTVRVSTAGLQGGAHTILFNRAAAASQAFSRKFPEVEAAIDAARKAGDPLPPLPSEVLQWLSRGVLEQIVGFMSRAEDDSWAIDIAIYEHELEEIVRAVVAAYERGVKVRVVYHARRGDDQTRENKRSLAKLPAGTKRARETQKICHHKFIILSKLRDGVRRPRAVLCGSTNFTHNGVYRQGNVVHVLRSSSAAREYLDLFEVLFQGTTPKQTRDFIDDANPISSPGPLFVGFSPRSGEADLKQFIRMIQGAKQDVLFCTAFDLYDGIEDALLGRSNDSILRYGLQNSRSSITGVHADRTADFTATAMLSKGLEGFLKESTKGQRGNILIHTKLVVVDFTSGKPTVISGSHNLSKAASVGNDENFLVLTGDTDVADCYGVELMRLYDHYRFRYYVKQGLKPQPLAADDGWTARYFKRGSLRWRDRLSFSGRPISA